MSICYGEELFRCIDEVDGRWLSEPFLHNPPAYRATSEKLSSFPILQKYVGFNIVRSTQNVRGMAAKWTVRQKNMAGWTNWIRFPNRGGSYSPDIMLQSLFELLAQKTHRYGAIGTGFDSLYLIVYYSSAAICNTPVETANFRKV